MTTVVHEDSLRDRATMLAMRGLLTLKPGVDLSPGGRPASDEPMAKVPTADGVTYVPAMVEGVPGWWCNPADAREDVAILHFHGRAYVVGSAAAYRNFVGQIAARAGIAAFAEYAPAPKRPFPAAFDDALAAYRGMVEGGHERIVLVGASAGGGLMLAFLAR